MKKLILIIFSFALLSSNTLIFAGQLEWNLKEKGLHVADLSEEDKINLQLNRLEQAIDQQSVREIEQILSPDYKEQESSLSKVSIKEKLESLFTALSQIRKFTTQTNPETGWKLTSTQDFSIGNTNIEIDGNKAVVACDIGLYSASKSYNRIEDTLIYTSENGPWFLSSSRNLFGLLERASHADIQQLGTVNSSTEVLTLTKDDLTSDNLLVPVILGNYGKTQIPRFNKTESLNWFDVNCMNSPYGIVADVEICEGGPDFNHNYLFVSDVTSQKIIGTRQDNWVAEFGTEGSGHGQFWGPHGMCTLEGTIYYVADMFNNRITCYEFYNQLDEPRWDDDWNINYYFNHPVDVEAKYRNNLQDQTYIAIADEYNHWIVIYHEYPYILGWDRNYGGYGSGPGQFKYPTSVCFGREPQEGWFTNDIYVTDYGNHRLARFYILPDGNTTWCGSYQFPDDVELTSVDVDNKGLVYVVDRRHSKVYKFATTQGYPYSFQLLGIWGEEGTADGQLDHPNTIQVAHGRYVPYPDPWVPLNGLGDVFVTESWGDQTGVRRFIIASDVLNLTAGWVPYNESTGGGNYIWWNYSLTDFATVTEQVKRSAVVCTTYNRGALNYGYQAGTWPVDGHEHGTNYTVKITATSIYDPSIVVEKSVDVYVDTMSIHNPVITQSIRCKHDSVYAWCNGCQHCITESGLYTVYVQAYDPDGSPLTYTWYAGDLGEFFEGGGMYHEITTDDNYVCYHAPWLGDKVRAESEIIKVTITGIHGGEVDNTVYPDIKHDTISCICGDVTGNGIIDTGDIVSLIQYLYQNGTPPVEPWERADANNSCELEAGDVTALINYLYCSGPHPVCCWIH